MGHREVEQVIGDMQHAPAGADGRQNLSEAAQHLMIMKGSESPAEFQNDMKELNKEMQAKGILPNVELVDVDASGQNIIVRDQNGATLARDASSIDNNLGALNRPLDLSDPKQLMLQAMGVNIDEINKSGLDIDDPNQFADLIGAHMMGADIKRNPDGSFDVDLALEKAKKAFDKVGSMFDGMLDGLSSSTPEYAQEQQEQEQEAEV